MWARGHSRATRTARCSETRERAKQSSNYLALNVFFHFFSRVSQIICSNLLTARGRPSYLSGNLPRRWFTAYVPRYSAVSCSQIHLPRPAGVSRQWRAKRRSRSRAYLKQLRSQLPFSAFALLSQGLAVFLWLHQFWEKRQHRRSEERKRNNHTLPTA